MKFEDLLSLAQSAAKIVTASGAIPGAGFVVEAVSEIVAVVRRNIDEGKSVLSADELGQITPILDQVHNRLMSLSDRLDRAADAASKL